MIIFDHCAYNVDNIVYLVENGGGGCYSALVCYYGRPGMTARLHPKSSGAAAAGETAGRSVPPRSHALTRLAWTLRGGTVAAAAAWCGALGLSKVED